MSAPVSVKFETARQIGELLPPSKHLSAEARMASGEFLGALEKARTFDAEPAVVASDGFEPFPKIPRLFRECVITEKIDGTNAQVIVTEDERVLAASRSRIITPADDNFGFAKWVDAHARELLQLGPGRHFGEWWGQGIQRGYGLKEKRFSLFNVARWGAVPAKEGDPIKPGCCDVVPTLYRGPFSTSEVDAAIGFLKLQGSAAAHGFPKPEGIIIWHDAARQMFKVTCERDEAPKGVAA